MPVAQIGIVITVRRRAQQILIYAGDAVSRVSLINADANEVGRAGFLKMLAVQRVYNRLKDL